MAYQNVDATAGNVIPPNDVNQIQNNFDALLDGSKRFSQITASYASVARNIQIDTSVLSATGGLQATGTGLYWNNTSLTAAGGGGGVVAISAYLDGNAYVAENIAWMRVGAAFTIDKVRIGAVTAPEGSTLAVDVNYHATNPNSATTIFTTQGNRPQLGAGIFTDDSGTPDVTSVADGGWLGYSIDSIGSGTTGENLVIEVISS